MKKTQRTTLAGWLAGAILLLDAAIGGAALPSTAPGSFDPTFGPAGSGRVTFSYGTNYDYGRQVVIQPDGKYLLAGYGSNIDPNIGLGFVARHLRDGSYDTSFNGTGRRTFGDDLVGQSVARILLQPDGKIVVIGTEFRPSGPYTGTASAFMTRLNADGSIDGGFGTAGYVRMNGTALPWAYFNGGALRPDGGILVSGMETDTDIADVRPFTMRFLANGHPDPAYGGGGEVSLYTLAQGLATTRMVLHASGKATLAGYVHVPGSKPAAYRATVVRINADGTPDTGFATGGKYTYVVTGFDNEFEDMVADTDGSLILVGEAFGSGASAFALRLTATGGLDPAFGTQGVVVLPVSQAQGVALQADRRIVIGGSRKTATSYDALALRLLPDGHLDTGFGAGGVSPQTFGYVTSYGWGVAIDTDGKIVMAGIAQPAAADQNSMLVRLIGVEITTPIVEFYNTDLNHYFITADPNEAAAIDAGAAGPGWTRTGETFKSGGPNRVCRFYGSPDIDPATGSRRGPNSHVYTIERDECAAIKQDAGWHFESFDFNGWSVAAGGVCPAGTIAVKRAYNKRFAENDSNHRYTTSDAIYARMLASGWSGEGTVFCAVQ